MEEFKKQLDGQAKTIDSERKLLDEQRLVADLDLIYERQVFFKWIVWFVFNRKAIESKRKELEDKEKKLVELDRQLQKRKEQMDQLEKSLQKAGGTAAAAGELNKKLTDTQRQLEA